MNDKDTKPQPVVVKDLSKAFAKPVLEGVNLTVDAGQIVTILGRSGTGKSVLLKLLIGIERPDAGKICLEGVEMTEAGPDEINEARKKTGFLFQQAALYDSMTIEDNVAFPIRRHQGSDAGEVGTRVKELLGQVGMESDGGKMPSEISGGMKKRVGLARALALNPEVLLLDEPTAGLDPITSAEIADLIAKIRKEKNVTCLIVTHDLHSARRIADRFVVLNEGRVLADGSFEDLEKSKDQFVVEFLKNAG